MSFENLGSLKPGSRPRPTLGSIWRGEEPLATTYWLYGVVVYGLMIGVVGTVLAVGIGSPPLFLVYLLLRFAATIFIIVAIWRSAGNYTGQKIWAILARVICILSAAHLVKVLVDFGTD
jgi:hypothetical protein